MASGRTPVKIVQKRFPDSKYCRVCGEVVVIHGGYYNIFSEKSKERRLADFLSKVLESEVSELTGTDFICKKCFRRIERFDATLVELAKLKESHKKNMEKWCSENPGVRVKRCTKSPSQAVKKARVEISNPALISCSRNEVESRRSLFLTSEKENLVLSTSTGTNIEVVLKHNSGSCVKHHPQDDIDRKAIKHIVLRKYSYAANNLWEKEEFKEAVMKKLTAEVSKECDHLCSVNNPSILRDSSPDGLKSFNETAHVEELKKRAPLFYSFLEASTSKKNVAKCDSDYGVNVHCSQSIAASALLRARCHFMSAQSYRLALVLWHSGARKQVYSRGVKWGITVGHTSTIGKIEEIGKNFNENVLKWKGKLEHHAKLKTNLETIHECLTHKDQANYDSPELAMNELTEVNFASPITEPEPELALDQATGTQMNSHGTLTLFNEADHLKEMVKKRMGVRFNEEVYHTATTFLQSLIKGPSVSEANVDLMKELINKWKSSNPAKYQIIGDNVDMFIKIKHQSNKSPNKSIHWFHMNAVKDRVVAADLPDDMPVCSIQKLQPGEFLPSAKDNQDLLHDFIPLFARVIIDKIPAFSAFKDVVVRHIPHKYSDVMKEKSEQEPLGLLFKNENLNDEMMDILSDIHDHYLPVEKTANEDGSKSTHVITQLFLGGDQLTEERARNSQKGRADGDSMYERLEGVIPKVEDWHASRILYQVMYDILFKNTSSSDVGTMCSNMNAVNQVNAKTKNVLDNFNYCKTFVKLESAAFITAATMHHFNMTDIKDKAEMFVPPAVLSDNKYGRRIWLHGQVKTILQKFVMNEQELYYDRLQQEVAEMNTTHQIATYDCSVCGKQYKYKKAKISHEAKVHSINQSVEQTAAKEPDVQKKVDARFNYACTRLSLGMLLSNFDDAVKEGDGERVMRCWKFIMLIFKAYNHTKYAFAGLQLQVSIKALLTPHQAQSLIWNRMVNTKGGSGKNISLDLRLEHLNKLLKDMLRCLGVNITEKSAERCSKALKYIEEILCKIDMELGVKKPKGQHITAKRDKDFNILVEEISKRGKLFACNPVNSTRQYQEFADFDSNILSHLDLRQVNRWISKHLAKF